MRHAAGPRLHVLSGRHEGKASAIDEPLEPVDVCFEEATAWIEGQADSGPTVDHNGADVRQAFQRRSTGLTGGPRSPWGHSPSVRIIGLTGVRSSSRSLDRPITGEQWQSRITALVEKDVLHATQQPEESVKAACDGVARSGRCLVRRPIAAAHGRRRTPVRLGSMRHYNRLERQRHHGTWKILALLDGVDVEVGPTPVVDWDGQRLRVRGPVTGRKISDAFTTASSTIRPGA